MIRQLSLPLSLSSHRWAICTLRMSQCGVFNSCPVLFHQQTVSSLKKTSPWSVKSTRWAEKKKQMSAPFKCWWFEKLDVLNSEGMVGVRRRVSSIFIGFLHRTRRSKPLQGTDWMTGDNAGRDLLRWVPTCSAFSPQEGCGVSRFCLPVWNRMEV